jgi:hypothetical protein
MRWSQACRNPVRDLTKREQQTGQAMSAALLNKIGPLHKSKNLDII